MPAPVHQSGQSHRRRPEPLHPGCGLERTLGRPVRRARRRTLCQPHNQEFTAVSDPLELVLELELQSIQDEIAAAQEQLHSLEVAQREAQDAEGQALEAAREAHAYADPLVWQTGKEHVSAQDETHVVQVGILVGDSPWRLKFRDAADALNQAQGADLAVQQCSARVNKLAMLHQHIEYDTVPY